MSWGCAVVTCSSSYDTSPWLILLVLFMLEPILRFKKIMKTMNETFWWMTVVSTNWLVLNVNALKGYCRKNDDHSFLFFLFFKGVDFMKNPHLNPLGITWKQVLFLLKKSWWFGDAWFSQDSDVMQHISLMNKQTCLFIIYMPLLEYFITLWYSNTYCVVTLQVPVSKSHPRSRAQCSHLWIPVTSASTVDLFLLLLLTDRDLQVTWRSADATEEVKEKMTMRTMWEFRLLRSARSQ